MKTFDFDQGTMEWNAVRAGVVTASEFKNLMTDKLEPRKVGAEMPQTYLCRKLAERWHGGPLPGFSAVATEFGHLREDEAVPRFELDYMTAVKRVGFILSDDGRCGCSPDGLLDESGLEVKCLEDPNHLKYLLAGQLPDEFAAQVHFSMFVTGFKSWHFYAYNANFPKLLVVVKRDEEIMERMADTLDDFLLRLDTAYKCLVKLNGGIEPAPNSFRESLLNPKVEEPAAPQPETNDVPIP